MAAKIRQRAGANDPRLEVHKVRLAGAVEQIWGQRWRDMVIARDTDQRSQDVAWVHRPELPLRFHVVLTKKIDESVLVERHIELVAHLPEDLAECFNRRVGDVDLVLDTTEKCFV